MENILDIAKENNGEQQLEIVPSAEFDFEVTFENAVNSLTDLDLVLEVEQQVLTTENAEMITYQLSRVGITSVDGEVLTTESAINGKDGFLSKLTNLKRRISASTEEDIGSLEKAWKATFGTSVSSLEKMKTKILKAKEESKTGKTELSKDDLKSINAVAGLANGMGLDLGKADDVIKLIQLPRVLSETVFKENSSMVEALQQNIMKDADSFQQSVKDGKLKQANESIKFLKSLKNIDIKDAEFIAGMPTKVFTQTCNLITVRVVDGKFVVDSDIVKVKPGNFKPLSQDDAIKVIDAAITEIKGHQKIISSVKASLTNINKGFPLVHDSSLVGGLANLLSKNVRYRQNLVKAGTNLMYDFYKVNKFAQKLASYSY